MKQYKGAIDDVQFYSFTAEQLEVEDLVVPGRKSAIVVYYQMPEVPRFRVTYSDSVLITDESDAAEIVSDVKSWHKQTKYVDSLSLIFEHDFESVDEFCEWEQKVIGERFFDVTCGNNYWVIGYDDAKLFFGVDD